MQVALGGKCSALVKVAPDLSDLFMGHSTWDSFTGGRLLVVVNVGPQGGVCLLFTWSSRWLLCGCLHGCSCLHLQMQRDANILLAFLVRHQKSSVHRHAACRPLLPPAPMPQTTPAAMLRIFKHYTFDLRQLAPATRTLSFSSYPGVLLVLALRCRSGSLCFTQQQWQRQGSLTVQRSLP